MKRKTRNALPKFVAWPVLIFLVFWDAFITYRGGREGNPLWQPAVEALGINALWLLAVLVLALFYAATKIVGMYTKRTYSDGEDLVLTTFVIAFATYDLYITFLLPYYGFLGSRSHYYVIPVLIVPVLIYNLWFEYRKRREKKN
ncbi:MAG: hypothetical protein HYW27_02170 [Candidatus Aenigmarchaeota archaeon]|nr:hypothetical protein [Candidatus Aenigmarchaeota archaeon]